MGSVNDKGRGRGPGGRRGSNGRRRQAIPSMESLENRRLLDGGGNLPTWMPTSADVGDIKNGPLANAGATLIRVYQDYQRYRDAGGNGAFALSPYNSTASYVKASGDYVAISTYGAGDLTTYVTRLNQLGFLHGGSDGATGLIEGLLPISQLPTVAAIRQTSGLRPQVYARRQSQGSANNQAEQALQADTAKQQFGVDGSGVVVGVLSDSVSRVGGGLAASVASGDVPRNPDGSPAVNVLFDDDTATGADEGRAMLELIYDIAPGAGLAYHNAFSLTGGETVMAAGIRRLATEAGARVITDDIGFAFEPFYQDGPAANAITDVTQNNGVTYTSAAGNSANHGFESPFRGVTGNVTGVGAGRFMDFDPGGTTNFLLPITVTTAGLAVFQYDQPFGVVNGVTSDVDVFIVDGNGAVVASGVTNNIASNQPYEAVNIPTAGAYNLVIQVKAGSADPGRVVFYSFFADVTFSQQFGNAGGISYPTTFGHPTADAAIGTGAVAWYDAPPFPSATSPVTSEDFSSFGPGVKVFNADGSRKPSVQIQQTPVLSGADASNTSFFGSPPGSVPPNLPANNYTQPNFFGTSAAAPNVAAVAALALDLSPNATPADVRAALIQSTIPLNGTPKGTWDVQGGFGLVQAVATLAAVDQFRVISSSPGNPEALAVAPQYLVFNFSRPVDVRSLDASDLVFTAYSTPGVTVTVGQPLVSDINNPTQVFFPLTFNVAPGVNASGAYAYTLRAGSITSRDGKSLVGLDGFFGVFDTVAPRVTNTLTTGRFVVVTFSEPINPATLTRSTIYLARTGASGVFGTPTMVVLDQDPRIQVTYDAAFNRAILDLSQLDQSLLPSDTYALIVDDTVTDALGNRLDGEFNGVFPSGDNAAGGDFLQVFGPLGLSGPQFLSLSLDPNSDTGIPADQTTRDGRPTFVGQIQSAFPGAIGGLTVVAQFNGLNGGTLNLGQGLGGRGFSGSFDVSTTTDATGRFSFRVPANLPAGFQTVRVVVVGASEQPPLPGLSTVLDSSFNIDVTQPIVSANLNSIGQNALISGLGSIVLDVMDPVLPVDLNSPFSVPTQLSLPALNPSAASNISNYLLVNLGSDNAYGGTGTAADVNYSRFITSAVFATVGQRTQVTDPFRGSITLNFAPGLPNGRYVLAALQSGLVDAAGNRIASIDPNGALVDLNFVLQFNLQPTPIYITSVQAATPDVQGTSPDPDTTTGTGERFNLSGPRSFYEIANPNNVARASAPPTKFSIDFSNPLGGDKDFTGKVLLIRSANTPISTADGDFGADPTFQTGLGYTVVPTTATVINSVVGAQFGSPGFRNRLIVSIPAGTSLPADHYRLYLPNAIRNTGQDLRVFDLFGNQLDGEFLGNPSPLGDGTYENLLGTGEIRQNDLTGDGAPGGAFETGYMVVPNGNVIFTKPDYLDDPNLSNDNPDGSQARPFATLAAEAVPTAANGNDLNSDANFTQFDTRLDRNGNGRFDRSAFVEAARRSVNGPVVIVALPSTTLASRTFVIQAPSGVEPSTNQPRDGSATVPYNTSLVFSPGTILKFFNASLFVQNQGSSIQVRGGPNPNQQVYFTSYLDDAIGGDTNGDGFVQPGSAQGANGGNWGGIVLRNFDDTSNGGRPVPVAPGPPDPLRPRLGVSGADEAMSSFNFANLRYAGGAVPQTNGFRYDAITNFNTRPAITNVTISQTGGGNSAQAAISGDVDSFREDDLARGILVRRANVFSNSINGIYVRAELNGQAQPTDAVVHPDNPAGLGGTQNYAFFAPLPYVLVSRLVVGQTLVQNSNGQTQSENNRFYFQPGSVVKFQRGAAIDVVNPGASINLGDRTYIREFDANSNFAPTDANFRPSDFGDAQVVFTSFFDDNASTAYRNPNTGGLTPIVAPIDSDNGGKVNLPIAGNVPALARWGGISVTSGAVAVIDEATLQFGGASVNSVAGTIDQRDVLAFEGAGGTAFFGTPLGTRAYATNNNFFDNLQAAISVDPNGLLATDPLRPLISGNPFFRGNVMQRNEINGMEVKPEFGYNGTNSLTGIDGTTITWLGYAPNVFTDTVWDDSDLTYVLRSTLRLAGFEFSNFGVAPLPAFPDPTGAFLPQLRPSLTLTVQSSLPDSLLANGQRIPRPGESALIKLLNTSTIAGDGVNGLPAGTGSDDRGGAGFIAGVDNGVEPPADPLIDPGYLSQLRFTGIAGNQTTGQQRVPVIITSIRDDTVGRTVRGVDMFQTVFGNTTAPAAGDGGLIVFGALGLSDYNLFDPRDGSIIDNADIRYLTRIEQQGGGWVYVSGDGSYNDRPGTQPNVQYNTAKALTVSNSNLSTFSQVGFLAHPSTFNQLSFFETPPPNQPFFARNATTTGQPTLTLFLNNTIANMPTGVRINGENVQDNTKAVSPAEAIFLNNTFYNNGEGIHTEAPIYSGKNALAHVHFLTMDNIFANSKVAAIQTVGMTVGSQGQYNLFSSNAADVIVNPSGLFPEYNENQQVNGSAQFRDPATGLFALQPNSDAIDSSRSEIGPLTLGNSLLPIVTQQLNATTGIRRTTGRTNPFGGLGFSPTTGDIVSLPGFPLRNFEDQWVAAITGSPGAIAGPSTNAGGTYSYIPIEGERDQAGFLRGDDPNRANVGFGSRPFFDIGAFEYIQLNPPHIIQVTAFINNPTITPGSPPTPENPAQLQVPFYSAGGVVGANQTPRQILFQFDQRLDPATVNNLTFVLQAAGGDGIFDNGNDRLLDLSGKLLYDASRQLVTLALADSNLALGNDVYRIQVFGSGGNVVRNAQGLALDGENTVGGQPNAPSLPLPSGDTFPGGNFFLTFTIDTTSPQIIAGSFSLAAASDSGPRDNITNVNRPSFAGRITDVAPPANPLLGQTAFIDVSTKGDGVFDRLGVAVGTTDAQGNFVAAFVQGQAALPETAYNVGPDGVLGTADDSGYSLARLRVVDQSGNVSNLNDPNAFVRFVVDTLGPRVVNTDPLQGVQAAALGSGVIAVSIAVNENINRGTFNANSVRAVRAGGDGIFGNANDVVVTIDPATFQVQNLGSGSGSQILRFNLTGATASDRYRVTLVGTGNAALTDIAGNPIDGEGTTFPSGDGVAGGDFNLDFVVFNPNASRLLFVAKTGGAGATGSRAQPFATIAAGLAAALPGDTVAVLPGVYTESIALKSLVKLLSADNASSDGQLVPGNALQTIIRAPASPNPTITVSGQDLQSIVSFQTEISGFTIAAPLVGDSAQGPINNGSAGLSLLNADVLVSKNYFVDAGIGVQAITSGFNAPAATFQSNGFIGNYYGLLIVDQATGSFLDNDPVEVTNNTFAFNTIGLVESSSQPAFGLQLAEVVNNIFWQNADRLSGQRQGTAIATNGPNRISVRNNLFSGNGASETSAIDDLLNVGNGINPANIGTTPDVFGNFTGNPAFVAPIDPRPEGSGPGNFFLGANYAIQSSSAAIDAAINSIAPPQDFLSRYRVDVPNRGRAGFGPADLGAFEFNGSLTPTTDSNGVQSVANDDTGGSGGTSTPPVVSTPTNPNATPRKPGRVKVKIPTRKNNNNKKKVKAPAAKGKAPKQAQPRPSGPASLVNRFNRRFR